MMNDILIEIAKMESLVWLSALLAMCALAVEEVIKN